MTRTYRFDCGCEWPILEDAVSKGEMPALDFDIDKAPMSCSATWKILGRGECKGVFQLESKLGSQWTKKLRPESIEHMGALGALLRPGCLRAVDSEGISMTAHYARRKNGEEPTTKYHPAIDAILSPTYGVLAYQEQSMAIAQAVAGFTLQEADMLRKSIGKKDAESMSKCKTMFMEGAKKAGILSDASAIEVFGWIQKSQRYSFNKCLAGTEMIRRPNGGRFGSGLYPIEEMYRIRNDIRYAIASGHEQLRRKWMRLGNYGRGLSISDDGRIRPNIIEDIQPAGVQTVFKIELRNGATIRATANHKFPTTSGVLTVQEIIDSYRSDKVELYVCGQYEESDFRTLNRFSDLTIADIRERGRGAVNGHCGTDNHSYTNGSYSEFVKNDEIIPRICERDPSHEGRLELHHKDGNRSNSHISNLERLCASCHKKAEYASGRTKRGEKGYPHFAFGIESIVEDGECETYDVTMAAPNHNFVTSTGIVTCNSHAISYGVVGYQCAYIKAHFPLIFYTQWLANADDKLEVYELVQDARLFDIDVQPPNLMNGNRDFDNDGKTVQFGVSNISGVGPAVVKKLFENIDEVEALLQKPLEKFDWVDFLTYLTGKGKTSSDVMKSLIRTGALRWLAAGLGRRRMEAEYEAWSEMTDTTRKWVVENRASRKWRTVIEALRDAAIIKKLGGGCHSQAVADKLLAQVQLLEKPPSPLEDTPHWIAWAEEQLLGISLSCSQLDACDLSQVNVSCRDYLGGQTGFLIFGVKVESVREVKTKKGKTPGQYMAFLSISDKTCALEDVVCFPETWREHKADLVQGTLVILQGERDEKNGSLVVKKVWPAT